jgi:hypothetical protein
MSSKIKEYNAQIRKDFRNEQFDDQVKQSEEDASDVDDDELDNKSDDEFLKHLEKEKNGKVNLDRLTKRQRMCHMAKNNLNQRGQFAIDNEAEANDFEDFSEGLPVKTQRRQIKSNISQAQQDEIKRKQLEAILEEQQKKMQDRQDKLKGIGGDAQGALGGVLGRYVTHNSKQALQRPGMEQFAISIKQKAFNKAAKDESFNEGPHPLQHLSGSELFFPKGVLLPECLRQQGTSEMLQKKMAERKTENKCNVCGNDASKKKYKCSKTKKITCSFDCYKTLN